MKILRPNDSEQSYQKVFKQIQSARYPLIIWQVFPENGKRVVHSSTLTSYDLESQLLNLSAVNDFLDPALPVYCYVFEEALIFKFNVREVKDDFFTTLFPVEMKLLEQDDINLIKSNTSIDINELWVVKGRASESHLRSMSQRTSRDQEFLTGEFESMTLDQEEKHFADKRESRRVRPKVQKLVKIIKNDESEMNFFDLFDLSRGGMSFVTSAPDHYPKGTEVKIVGFDAFDLDDPLYGAVTSHRQMDGSEFDVKVGIKFHQGQD